MAKILLVEDDKSLREIYGVRLMAEGYQIVSAGDGEEALAMAIKERPDLIVSDVMMPKISGFDMLDILRSTTETKDVKVIMMTALSSEDQRARGEALGADRYLVKSQVGIEDVVRTVHDVLGDSPAAAAQPSFPSTAPLPPATPALAPIMPAPTPIIEPLPVVPSTAPIPTPMPQPLSAPTLAPEPAITAQPTFVPGPQPVAAPPVMPVAPAPLPVQPVAAPAPQPIPVMPAPAAPVVPPSPVIAPAPLPQPTAPFSSPRPASLGDRVINPISATESFQVPPDMGTLMSQELGGAPTQPPQPPVPPVPGV
jgi:CheY-like chemotaxis protein